jgi:HCOMODA/2-hydroxy-3-carboxy-muconic semialdehyde decarboxylase
MCTTGHGAMDDGASVAAPAADRGAAGPAAAETLIADLVTANRILFDQGVLDAFGHVSVRHDKRSDRFLLARNMAPALVKADDIVEFDEDGEPVNAAGRSVYLERFIHSEIYRARPDVMAVVHSHSMAVLPFGLVKSQPFRAVTHMGSFIGVCAPIFEIRDVVGDDNDLLITNRKLGAALAATLGQGTVALMRGHGSTAVGNSLKQAVFRAVYTEQNARVLSEALRIGPVEALSEAETRTATRTIDTQVDRAWNMWRLRVEGKV